MLFRSSSSLPGSSLPPKSCTLRAFRTAVEEYGAGIFDTEIPLREDFKADFGHTFRSNLNGYEDVWNELRGELR